MVKFLLFESIGYVPVAKIDTEEGSIVWVGVSLYWIKFHYIVFHYTG